MYKLAAELLFYNYMGEGIVTGICDYRNCKTISVQNYHVSNIL